jgi:outer membrane lipoprotein SlyB
MMKFTRLILVSAITATLAACATSNSGEVYSREDARKVQTVRMGVVESIRQVKLEGTKSPIGTIAGGVVGGIAGSAVGGNDKVSAIAAVIGAVAGGIAGAAIEEGTTRADGIEITVKLDSGALIAIVQEATDQFTPGERVRLIESNGNTRVSH